jgi:predicted alpha-1,2-mannosidase
MERVRVFLILFNTLFFLPRTEGWCQSKKTASDYVNPFIGTQYLGKTNPGAELPFSMVNVGPVNYKYESNTIAGFGSGRNGVLFQPTVTSNLQVTPGSPESPDEGYISRFDHADERASAGFYSVLLKDDHIKVELTATKRAAFHRYTFPKTNNANVIIDMGSGKLYGSSQIAIINDTQIEGYKKEAAGAIYFFAEFNKPFHYYGTFENESISTNVTNAEALNRAGHLHANIYPYKNEEIGAAVGAFVTYNTTNNEEILVKVGMSYVSMEGARKNVEAEIRGWDFDNVKNEAKKTWNSELSRISVSGATEADKEIFYTAAYRSLGALQIAEDVDGKYFGVDEKVHAAQGYDYYGEFSCWDTYRSEHPLLTIIAPSHVNDFGRSIAASVKDFGWLPGQHFQNASSLPQPFKNPTSRWGMVGDHLIPIVVDAYIKGYRDFDIESIYQAMRIKALEPPKPPIDKNAGRSGIEHYVKLGYTPVDKGFESVSTSLETTYDDWCIAQLANALGKTSDYNLFMTRASNYRNLWDPETEFFRPRLSDGHFLKELGHRQQKEETTTSGDFTYYTYFDPLLVGKMPYRHYSESNAWQYIWAVQHDVQGLINLFGGREKFNRKLDSFYDMSPSITGPKYIGVVGTIGQYVHGNQPSWHATYFYDYSGEPWKAQARVRQICEEFYRTGPGGLSGNEDQGSNSAFYLLSSMGFYPVTPGSTSYAIGSPHFKKLAIDLGHKKAFVVQADNNSKVNMYIQSATLNGQALNKPWITQDDIMKGGILIFKMGPKPNKKWGAAIPPPSMSK